MNSGYNYYQFIKLKNAGGNVQSNYLFNYFQKFQTSITIIIIIIIIIIMLELFGDFDTAPLNSDENEQDFVQEQEQEVMDTTETEIIRAFINNVQALFPSDTTGATVWDLIE